jgi:hypothetical protein
VPRRNRSRGGLYHGSTPSEINPRKCAPPRAGYPRPYGRSPRSTGPGRAYCQRGGFLARGMVAVGRVGWAAVWCSTRLGRLGPGSPYHKPDCYPVDAGFTPPLGLPGHWAGVKAVFSAAQRVEITLALETTRAVPRLRGWSGPRSSGKCPFGCLGSWTGVWARGQSACLTRSGIHGAHGAALAHGGRARQATRSAGPPWRPVPDRISSTKESSDHGEGDP